MNKKILIVFSLFFFFLIAATITFFLVSKKPCVKENLSVSKSNYVFGVDISHYQGRINWNSFVNSKHPIKFIFFRATMGANSVDKKYDENIDNGRNNKFIVGSYHFFRPDENSTMQFENFKNNASVNKGDLIPVLDIEHQSKFGNDSLMAQLKIWLNLAEAHYGIKPMIYTGSKFYKSFIKGNFDEYPVWIAAYSDKSEDLEMDWAFHQFTDKVRVKGVNTSVDGNNFKGKIEELKKHFCLN
jgi:GH25 family lysozyme M1 (1,4-beta-N-acetylmuramidase)